MPDRRYRGSRVEELDRLTQQYWNSRADLEHVAHELTFRTTSAAHRLQHKVRLRIAELPLGGSGQAPGSGHTPQEDLLFSRVGLHPNAPTFVIKAARKAFRAQYHPDVYSTRNEAERRTAEEKFKEYDNVFDAIEKIRTSG